MILISGTLIFRTSNYEITVFILFVNDHSIVPLINQYIWSQCLSLDDILHLNIFDFDFFTLHFFDSDFFGLQIMKSSCLIFFFYDHSALMFWSFDTLMLLLIFRTLWFLSNRWNFILGFLLKWRSAHSVALWVIQYIDIVAATLNLVIFLDT